MLEGMSKGGMWAATTADHPLFMYGSTFSALENVVLCRSVYAFIFLYNYGLIVLDPLIAFPIPCSLYLYLVSPSF